MALQASLSSSSSTFDYHVFLSFRGSDTRFSFTDNLYHALDNKGIRTFIDDRELHGGEDITSTLFNNIQNSMIAIIVFSNNYASSTFCLDELSHIMDSFKGNDRRLVLPIFYDMDPTHVRHQTGSYGNAIADHEKEFQENKEKYSNNFSERLQKWKTALQQAANLSGHHFTPRKEYEYGFIEKIVDVVSNKINRAPLHVGEYRVGLESRVLQVKSLLKMESNVGVCIVGIHGIGGIGKTTLAREVYNSIANQFEVLCFLDAVSEKTQKHGLVHLQETLLRETIGEKDIKLESVSKGISIIKQRLQTKKVLLILDDVDDLKQLKNLVGESNWLGQGSRVIVTTRDTQLLASHGIEMKYEVGELDEEKAFELLRCTAFKQNKVALSYEHILKRVVTYAAGLPLALEVIGSTLCGKKHIEEWEFLLSQYERIPHKDIQKILEVSFDALGEEEKSVFLDIACCFKGYELEEVKHILCAHYGECKKYHIQVLVEKSLIKTSSLVTLHDLVEAMGKEIVRRDSPEELGKRSRLWFHEDIVQVLKDNTGTSKIKIIRLDFPLSERKEKNGIKWKGDELKSMRNLKTLIIKNGRFSNVPRHIPNELRVLEWYGYPSPYLPSDFWPKKLSICKLGESFFKSFRLLGSLKELENMRHLNLDNCQYLEHIHDVSGLPNLETFSFQSCKSLIKVHESVGFKLNKLKRLEARGCTNLKSFPSLKLTSLENLELSGCTTMKSFPEILEEMQYIREIDLNFTSIEKLPLSFQNLTGLEWLGLSGRGKLTLSSSIFMMPKLKHIAASGFYQLLFKHNDDLNSTVSSNVTHIKLRYCDLLDVSFPIVIKWFTDVVKLNLSGSKLRVLPVYLIECHFLKTLIVDECQMLTDIIEIPPNLKKFSALGCHSLSSSCKRMLMSQERHEYGGTKFVLKGTTERWMLEWFESRSRGPSISFWFRNKVPSVALYAVTWLMDKQFHFLRMSVDLFIDGCYEYHIDDMHVDCTYLLDLQLELQDRELESKLQKRLSNNEWIHAEVRFQFPDGTNYENQSKITIDNGIHVLTQKSSTEDIQFTDPCKMTSSGEDSNGFMQRFRLRVQQWVMGEAKN